MAGGRRHHYDQLTIPPFATADGDAVRVSVRVTPRARRSEIAGVVEGADGKAALAVKLAASPVEGAANKALAELLAKRLRVPRSAITIVGGERSRLKSLRIAGLAPAALAGLAP